MFWLLVLSTVFLGIGVIVFVLTRDSFRASRARRETSLVAPPVKNNSGATAINTMMQEKLPVPPPSHPATLFSGQGVKETDDLADDLAQVKESPILPSESRAYLCLEEHDDSLERLLIRRVPGAGASREPPREFFIGVTEKKEAPLEHEKAM
jgi:hypothetical protein